MVVAEWDVTAMMLDGSELNGIMPTVPRRLFFSTQQRIAIT
jgi:hypothetical protein